jgi:NAD-dependent dihydropyrimidine dehydrogenase PreA subunit
VPYVITTKCVDIMDKTCVRECPVDCIYEGARSLYINPHECVDCGACEPVCPNEAIYFDEEVPHELQASIADNANFFLLPLHGGAPLGNPGGARDVGPIAVDTPVVAGLPPQNGDRPA